MFILDFLKNLYLLCLRFKKSGLGKIYCMCDVKELLFFTDFNYGQLLRKNQKFQVLG